MKKEQEEQIDLCEQELMLLHNRMILLGNDLEKSSNPKEKECFELCGMLKEIHDGLIKLREE